MTGSLYGRRRGLDLFIEDGAYTTVAAAVSMLMVMTLLFSAATAVWSMSRAGDTQATADACALAGSNVVSSYCTAATVIDASVLSMGLAGFCVTGAGLVGLLVPGANATAAASVKTGIKMIKTRNDFAASASRGLQKLERSLPYLVAANSASLCAKRGTDSLAFTGVALAVPTSSASQFPAAEEDQVPTDALEDAADSLDAVAQELAKASERTQAAKEEAWLADCGRDGMNMQERVARLSDVPSDQNPDYASSITWDPVAGLDRARAYYRWRAQHDRPEGTGDEAKANSAARRAWCSFAAEQLKDAVVEENDGEFVSTVPLLPRNRAELEATSLFTDSIWPTSVEEGGRTIHYDAGCRGARGISGGAASVAQEASGAVKKCPVCSFGAVMLGNTPAASTSINNGFEYHLREYTLALQEYSSCRNEELALERKARDRAESSASSFGDAIKRLGRHRPSIAPPGRYGCVAAVVAGEAKAPETLDSSFAPIANLAQRGAVSAAALAPDPATSENNVLASFFSTLEDRSASDADSLVGSVMKLWGRLLVSYGDLSAGLDTLMDDLLSGLRPLGFGPVASWLGDSIRAAVTGLGLEAVDLRLKKPVLTDSARVLAHADTPGVADMQDALRSIPLGTTDPVALLQALGYRAEEYLSQATFTLAEIPLPGGGSIPLTIRLRDIVPLGGGAT